MKTARSILVVDDHALLRDGMRALLSAEPDLEIVGEADNGRDAVRMACALKPELVLMDLSMPGIGGLDALAEIKRRSPEVRVLILTLHRTEEYVQAAFRFGAAGYLLKDSGHVELLAAIRTVLVDKTYLSPAIADRMVRRLFSGDSLPTSAWETLTLRERQVLKLVAEGCSNRDIASYLFLSVKTVEKHRASLMHKLGMRNASGLTAYAIEKGLLGAGSSASGCTRTTGETRSGTGIPMPADITDESERPCS